MAIGLWIGIRSSTGGVAFENEFWLEDGLPLLLENGNTLLLG